VLGYLDAESFLGGEMQLRTREVHKALTREVAGPLGLDTTDAAAGIVEVVTGSMAAAARMHLSEQGRDPADFALLAFGGAGPVHAYGLAKVLKMPRVIVPMRAGVMSACGLLAAAPTVDGVRSLPSSLADVDWDQVAALYDGMITDATRTLEPADPQSVRIRRSADMRYLGQGFEIEVDLPEGDLGPADLGRIRAAFESTYRAVFGRSLDGAAEVVNWRLSMRLPDHDLSTGSGYGRGEEASRGVRSVHFPGYGLLEAAVWNRYELKAGTELAGPAIFEEREASCSFGPDCRIRVTDDLTLVVEVSQ
jgi:N-methylhydantoinase A